MRKLGILALIFLVQCTSSDKKSDVFVRDNNSDTATILYQYWTLADADKPLESDVIYKDDGRDMMPGIVFIQNNEVVENPAGKIRRGQYERFNDSIHVRYEDGTDGSYIIKLITPDTLVLTRNGEKVTNLLFSATQTWWPDVAENPFTAQNMAWTIKPATEESEAAIKERCEAYIRFCQYYIEGYSRGGATKISFVGIPNIFNYYHSAISIPADDKLNPKWVDCFYDKKQAQEGYILIRRAIIKDYKWDKDEPNWINQTPSVLKAMRDSL